jgi:small subunit ribosomal protein SAe
MSNGIKCLELNSNDARKLLASKAHLGNTNCNYQMAQYVFKRDKTSGAHVFDLTKMWEKIQLSARIIAAVENSEDVCLVSGKDQGQRAILKLAKFIGASSINGRFSPGTFTNHSQSGYREPRLIIVTDPTVDHQAIREASYVNIPVISLVDCDAALKYIDIGIPCNNRSPQAIGLIYWFLTREVLHLRGKLNREEEWDVMPDLFFYRNQEEIKKQEEADQKAQNEVDAPLVEEVADKDDNGFEMVNDADFQKPAESAENWAAEPNADWSAEPNNANQDWAAAESSNWS